MRAPYLIARGRPPVLVNDKRREPVCKKFEFKAEHKMLEKRNLEASQCRCRKYAKNRLSDQQVYSNLSNCNYRIFVKKILLEIGFIGLICPARRYQTTLFIEFRFRKNRTTSVKILLYYIYRESSTFDVDPFLRRSVTRNSV